MEYDPCGSFMGFNVFSSENIEITTTVSAIQSDWGGGADDRNKNDVKLERENEKHSSKVEKDNS